MNHDVDKYYTWSFDATSIVLRYFLLAGIGYFVFYLWKHKRFSSIKIQKNFPVKAVVLKEIAYSSFTLLLYCMMSGVVFYFQKAGKTEIYLNIDQYGYGYMIFSFF